MIIQQSEAELCPATSESVCSEKGKITVPSPVWPPCDEESFSSEGGILGSDEEAFPEVVVELGLEVWLKIGETGCCAPPDEELLPETITEVELEVWLKIGDMDGGCAPPDEEFLGPSPGNPVQPAIRSSIAENTSEIAKIDFPIVITKLDWNVAIIILCFLF